MPLAPKLENRTLRLDPKKAAFYYEYRKCKRRFISKKCEWIREEYDLTKPEVRHKLINMGFRLRSKGRFKK